MKNLFDQLKENLGQAIEFEKGKKSGARITSKSNVEIAAHPERHRVGSDLDGGDERRQHVCCHSHFAEWGPPT